MKPWQASRAFLSSNNDDPAQDFIFDEEEKENSSKTTRLHSSIPYSWPDLISQFDGTIFSQEHRPNKRADFLAENRASYLQIIKIDEQIMWKLFLLEKHLDRLYLLREIRNELYLLNNLNLKDEKE